MRSYAATLMLLLSAACASSPVSPTSGYGGQALAARAIDAPQYILLEAPAQIRNAENNMASVYPLHIAGTLTNRGFMPAGNIQGHGKFCTEGKDWLSLAELAVHRASGGKEPVAPYVMGCVDANGFQPASREIVTE